MSKETEKKPTLSTFRALRYFSLSGLLSLALAAPAPAQYFLTGARQLSASSQSAADAGSGARATLEGELQILVVDYPDHAITRYFLKRGDERFDLVFTDAKPDRDMHSGSQVRVSGLLTGRKITVDSITKIISRGFSVQDAHAQQSLGLSSIGEQKVLVFLVNFRNDTREPFTVQEANDAVFGEMNNFYREASFGQTWLSGDVVGWYTLPMDMTPTCNTLPSERLPLAAAEADGIDTSAYERYILIFPNVPACGFAGLAVIGGNVAWINGYLNYAVIGHEFGHNLGLWHANALDCLH